MVIGISKFGSNKDIRDRAGDIIVALVRGTKKGKNENKKLQSNTCIYKNCLIIVLFP